jgi:hypothetical protein
MIPKRIISGGQTGVDRAALDVALALGIPCGGWCPRGRWAEDGPIDPRYPLRETRGSDPGERTKRNVADGDATLIMAPQPLGGGTAVAHDWAETLDKILLVIEPNASNAALAVVAGWLAEHTVQILNVAGPRESESPGIYRESRAFFTKLWTGDAAGAVSGEEGVGQTPAQGQHPTGGRHV